MIIEREIAPGMRISFELTADERLEAYNEQQDIYYRCNGLRYFSEKISDCELIEEDGDVKNFLNCLDDGYKQDFMSRYGMSVEDALDADGYDLLGRISDCFDSLYAADSSDCDRWMIALDKELDLLRKEYLAKNGPYRYYLTAIDRLEPKAYTDENKGLLFPRPVFSPLENELLDWAVWEPKDRFKILTAAYAEYGVTNLAYGFADYKLPLDCREMRGYNIVPANEVGRLKNE